MQDIGGARNHAKRQGGFTYISIYIDEFVYCRGSLYVIGIGRGKKKKVWTTMRRNNRISQNYDFLI